MSAPVAAGNLWSVMIILLLFGMCESSCWFPKCVFRRIVADSAHIVRLRTYYFRLLLCT
jgi:hypothetical protein